MYTTPAELCCYLPCRTVRQAQLTPNYKYGLRAQTTFTAMSSTAWFPAVLRLCHNVLLSTLTVRCHASADKCLALFDSYTNAARRVIFTDAQALTIIVKFCCCCGKYTVCFVRGTAPDAQSYTFSTRSFGVFSAAKLVCFRQCRFQDFPFSDRRRVNDNGGSLISKITTCYNR